MTAPAPLLLATPGADPDTLLDGFLTYCADQGLTLYRAQEEAILELFAGRDVVLNTPTGSGKSLVAIAAHLLALSRGDRSVYTSPIKALVSEKFFALCAVFGPERVGMMTGDGVVNGGADIVCCTAEVLASMALREGADCPLRLVVMDEFHYYADATRGTAWQVPLLLLCRATFLLMSATLGDTDPIAARLDQLTGHGVAVIKGAERPVPLEFEYAEQPLLDTISGLVKTGRAPVYLVNFSQREASELAQSLASTYPVDKEHRGRLKEELAGFRFDSPYGKKVRAMIEHGVGVHHAGLLPKYRRLVERLAQRGLLSVISGTDTLGVGVNVPIRTVLFTRLYKFDGEKRGILSVRDFHQIAGRAGRKGFDTRGYVVCQAPAHVVENRRLEARVAAGLVPKKKLKKEAAPKDYVPYDEATFVRLNASAPEPLTPRFAIDVGMLLGLMQRDPQRCGRDGGYGHLLELIDRSHGGPTDKVKLGERAALLLESLIRAGIVQEEVVGAGLDGPLRLRAGLEEDFSVFHSLGLFLLHGAGSLAPDDPQHTLKVVSLVESIQENPRPILMAQQGRARGEKIGELKREGLDYHDRMEALEDVTWPKPDSELIYTLWNDYAASRPWLSAEHVRPKAVSRELIERGATFADFVRELRAEPVEGVLLRYLTETWRVLDRTLPEELRTDGLLDATELLRAAVAAADSSLLAEWEQLVAGGDGPATPTVPTVDLRNDARRLAARVRAELAVLLRALGGQDWETAEGACHPESALDAAGLERALVPFFEEFGSLRTDHTTRLSEHTRLTGDGEQRWTVVQRLLDPEGEGAWALTAVIDLRDDGNPVGPFLRVLEVGE